MIIFQQTVLGPISDEEILKSILELRNKSSCGASDIPPEWLKSLDGQNRMLLHNLFQHWYDQELVPEESLSSQMQLLYKSGARSNIKKHHSISLQCNILKIYSKIIFIE